MPSNFIAFLHENYPSHYECIHDLCMGVDMLSLSDLFLQDWRVSIPKSREKGQTKVLLVGLIIIIFYFLFKEKDASSLFALNIAVRGLMVSNKNTSSSWNLVRGPKNLKNE